jgi:hypothetical protein
VEELARTICYASGVDEMTRSKEAQAFWQEVYSKLTAEAAGTVAAMTSRGDAQVLRLSMIYALVSCPLIT